jgi:hypothetical protein
MTRIVVDDMFAITASAYRISGYTEVDAAEAELWSVSHYQTNVKGYGSGWFPAYVRTSTPCRDLKYKYPTLLEACAGLRAYREQEGLV